MYCSRNHFLSAYYIKKGSLWQTIRLRSNAYPNRPKDTPFEFFTLSLYPQNYETNVLPMPLFFCHFANVFKRKLSSNLFVSWCFKLEKSFVRALKGPLEFLGTCLLVRFHLKTTIFKTLRFLVLSGALRFSFRSVIFITINTSNSEKTYLEVT